jgi:Raf kinase inhibitor-like YbhB/YbcL family protein
MKLVSAAYAHNGPIPKKFTCEGENVSPDFKWSEAPKNVKSFALVIHDPDAPRPDGFTHWLLYNIPAATDHIPENLPHELEIEDTGIQGTNDAGGIGYTGPCPPSGTHRYFARLYALNAELQLGPGAGHKDLLKAMQGKILEQAEWMGTYAKTGKKVA